MTESHPPHHRAADPCVFCKSTGCDATGIVVIDNIGTPIHPCTLVGMHLNCFRKASSDGYIASTK